MSMRIVEGTLLSKLYKLLKTVLWLFIPSWFTIESYNIIVLLVGTSVERWIIILPLGILYIFKHIFKNLSKDYDIIYGSALSIIILAVYSNFPIIKSLYNGYSKCISVVFTLFILLIYKEEIINNKVKQGEGNKSAKGLFNLFYINTSKVHEIAMLIDNRIMKSVENQRDSEEKIKNRRNLSFGKKNNVFGVHNEHEQNFKKTVFEKFDVKITKSIMLKKIYSYVKKNNKDNNSAEKGDLVLFNNISLEQINADDTITFLNVFKDSNMNQKLFPDELDLNINRVIEEMLSDFTFDYTFSVDNKNYIIRLPYNKKEHFENDYSHSDLQFGELSVVGIYRDEVDFSGFNSISSKFLQSMSDTNQSTPKVISVTAKGDDLSSSEFPIPDKSIVGTNDSFKEFNMHHKKTEGIYHYIDVLAIIQEINITED
ncbi:MAG: hypothetical protein N4A40_12895 [Tissierellales bacterium]|jgi:hypothetical protein|nr:hypothetical protein [Tissierellales bacterium]